MKNPFRRTEKRESYTDARLQNQVAVALGSVGKVVQHGALEAAAGIYASAFASATITGASPLVSAALTPSVLSQIGRSLIRYGEYVAVLELNDDVLELIEAAVCEVSGGASPSSWRYQIGLATPDGQLTRHLPSTAVVHLRYASEPNSPWRGQGPLQLASELARLAANMERSVANQMNLISGMILPVPYSPDAEEEDDDVIAPIVEGLRTGGGKHTILETTSAGWAEGRGAAPQGDWMQRYVGGAPPDAVVELRREIGRDVLRACGISPVLQDERAPGAALQSGYRQLLALSIQPLGELVAGELRVKLDSPDLSLDFSHLAVGDLLNRANAFSKMTEAGIDAPHASALAGLRDPD